ISRSRATRPLIKYSLCPERYSRRLTTTSPGFIAKTGFSAAFFRRFPLPNSRSAAPSSPSAPRSCRGAACCAPAWLDSSSWSSAPTSPPAPSTTAISCRLFSVPSVLPASVNSVLIPGISPALSSTNRAASASSASSIVSVTSANPIGGRFVVPLKMQSAMRSARSDLWLCSPSTQEIASTTFDFPHPFGPTMHVVPVPLNVTTVRSQNDLNPVISTFRSLSKVSPLVPHRTLISDWHATTTRATILSRPLVGGATPLRNKHHGPLVQRETKLYLQGRSYRRRQSDRDAVARQNVWQVLDQSPAAWRVNGGTGKNTSTKLSRCKALRNR